MKKLVLFFSFAFALSGCQTKSEIRREQELEHLKTEVGEAKEGGADIQETVDELKVEVARLGNVLEGKGQQNQQQLDTIQKDLSALSTRIQALEQRAVQQDLSAKQAAAAAAQAAAEKPKTLADAKKLFDDKRYDEAVEVLKGLTKVRPRTDDTKKAQVLLADSYFADKDFASAAIAYGDFEKAYPHDPGVPQAIFNQAKSFQSMGDAKDAKLFYQELVERFPKNKLSAKAKKEMHHLK
jgi:TolA-binding protein